MNLHLTYDQDEAASHVEFLRDRLYVIRTLVPLGYEAYFRERARYINAQTSASIEGNPIGEQRALFVLVEGADVSAPAEVEITNLEEAYQLIQQLAADESMRVDHGLIRTMNSIVLKDLPTRESENRGRYRSGPSLIVDSQSREIRYRPPPPEWVPDLMDGLISDIQRWMASDEHSPPVVAALAHFGLISIHPFEDGNGRTARLLADMILQQSGWSGDGMVAVSQVIWDRRHDYYESLRETQGEDFKEEIDATQFVEFHTQSLGVAAGQLEDRVVSFNRRRDDWMDTIGSALNPRQTLGLMFMLDISPLSTSKYARLTGASQSSAYADLTYMVDAEILERTGRGRNTRYTPSERFLRAGEGVEPEKAE